MQCERRSFTTPNAVKWNGGYRLSSFALIKSCLSLNSNEKTKNSIKSFLLSSIIPNFAGKLNISTTMKYAIIAAGEGSRLVSEGVAEPKPLVRLGGETLIDRLVRIFTDNGATGIVIVYRSGMDGVAAHVSRLAGTGAGVRHVPVEAVEALTPSSMHSLMAIADRLEGAPFCLTTVDTVFAESAFSRYVAALSAVADGSLDGVMGVTGYVDDEKPLYVNTDGDMNITAFLDSAHACRYVSAGVYGLSPRSLGVLRACVEAGESRMRNFQRALLRGGLRLKAEDMGMVFDIDHAADIAKAESFIRRNV